MGRKTDDFRICEDHLGLVSRTFAVNMKVLRGDAYRCLLLAYLLCRIADTIEDDPSLSPGDKIIALTMYGELFPPQPNWASRVTRFLEPLSGLGSGPEAILLQDTSRVFSEFVRLPPSSVAVISKRVREMAEGMASFQRMDHGKGGIIMLADQRELERYCYYVAGTVGLMITALFFGDGENNRVLPPTVYQELHSRSVSFGLGLQMTNIAKDFLGDRQRGWCFVPRSFFQDEGLDPERPMPAGGNGHNGAVLDRLVGLALKHLDESLLYLLAIPRRFVRYRLFCLLPLLMAVETLARVEQDKDRLLQGGAVKISRSDVARIVRNSFGAVLSNGLVRLLYRRARRKTGVSAPG